MTKEELIEKIANTGIKLIMRKYPFVVSGDFVGTFTSSFSYLKLPNDVKSVTGVRIILTIDPEIFFSMYSKKSNLYPLTKENRVSWTIRYLSTIYDKTDDDYQELDNISEEILNIFYQTDSVMNPNKKIGYLDFFVRYVFLGSKVDPNWFGFSDHDTSIPYKQYRR